MQMSLLETSAPRDAAAKRAEELRRLIEQNNRLYYVLDEPAVSDADYDALFRELQQLEGEYPELLTPDSPTQRVGGVALEKFATLTHRLPLLSLENATNELEIREFDLRIKKILGLPAEQEINYICEPKMFY